MIGNEYSLITNCMCTEGRLLNVPIRMTMHLFSVIPAIDTRESVFGHRNFPRRERGSNLGLLAPEASA